MRQSIIGITLCLLLGGLLWLRQDAPEHHARREIFALGTLIQITVVTDDHLDEASAQQAINAAGEALQVFHKRWSANGDGDLARLNQVLADSSSAPLPAELVDDVHAAIELCRRSQRRFDPALGELVRLWGFHDENEFRSTPPPDEQIRGLLAGTPSLCDAQIEQDRIRFKLAGPRLDFGAAAKGRAVGRAIQVLREHGVHAAIINAGGDLQVLGAPAGRNWRIGIRHPRPEDGQDILAALDLAAGESVFTSGDYERYFLHAGQRYHHILDPATGYPASGLISATVVHADPWLGDAASTALFVAGPEAGPAVMQAMGIENYLWVDAKGQRFVSPGLASRIQWRDDAS